MSPTLSAFLFLFFAVLIFWKIANFKRKFGVFQFILYLIVISLLVSSYGLFYEKDWAKALSISSLVAFILFILLPPLGRLLGLALFTKMYYKGMEEEEEVD